MTYQDISRATDAAKAGTTDIAAALFDDAYKTRTVADKKAQDQSQHLDFGPTNQDIYNDQQIAKQDDRWVEDLPTKDSIEHDETGSRLSLGEDGDIRITKSGKIMIKMNAPSESTTDPKTGQTTLRITDGVSRGDEFVFDSHGFISITRNDGTYAEPQRTPLK